MPAMLDDPTAPVIYRTSGAPPYPTPSDPSTPATIVVREVTLRDRQTIASLMPFGSQDAVPPRLLEYLASQLNVEIEKGDTYPMVNTMTTASFGTYWFQNFGAIMILGAVTDSDQLARMENEGAKWEELCLGSFYIKPNYPGRSSHVANAGFLVTHAARNKGVGRLMGEVYLEWAPRLGYTYSVFNLVYENNVASMRIWDALGFKRIGRVKGAGNMRSHPDELVDAIIYGRDLGPEAEDYVSEERFDKIRFYLKNGTYPQGADRAEKSRLRSAATHYRLIPTIADDGTVVEDEEKLMLKDKEVISDPKKQYEISRVIHQDSHGGINKTTATIAEKYHWVRIKETVSLVIKNCHECKDTNQKPTSGGGGGGRPTRESRRNNNSGVPSAHQIEQLISFSTPASVSGGGGDDAHAHPQSAPIAQMHAGHPSHHNQQQGQQGQQNEYSAIPLDPQIMSSSHQHPYHPDSTPSSHDFTEQMRQVAEFNNSGYTSAAPQTQTQTQNHTEAAAAAAALASSRGDDEDAMQIDSHQHHRPSQQQQQPEVKSDDTRLATERHVKYGDEPMAYQLQRPINPGPHREGER